MFLFFCLQRAKKAEGLTEEEKNEMNLNPCGRDKSNCTIFLGYTSNMASCGTRETIRFLAQHNMVREQSSVDVYMFFPVIYPIADFHSDCCFCRLTVL